MPNGIPIADKVVSAGVADQVPVPNHAAREKLQRDIDVAIVPAVRSFRLAPENLGHPISPFKAKPRTMPTAPPLTAAMHSPLTVGR
jgi:hypothetical protein